jgi:hypothetical protein
MWGVYEESKEVHVIPCDMNGNIEEPHTIDCFCVCVPECIAIGEDGRLIINHNKEN